MVVVPWPKWWQTLLQAATSCRQRSKEARKKERKHPRQPYFSTYAECHWMKTEPKLNGKETTNDHVQLRGKAREEKVRPRDYMSEHELALSRVREKKVGYI